LHEERRRDGGHKLQHGKFQQALKKMGVSKLWNMLPRKSVDSSYLEIFETQLDEALRNLTPL